MQAHIRKVAADQFSELDRFKKLKEKDELLKPAVVGQKIIKLVNNASNYNLVLLRIDEL
jgi:hypothetical protein